MVGVLSFIGFKTGNLSLKTLPLDLANLNYKSFLGQDIVANIKTQVSSVSGQQLAENLSSALDSLVTHADKNSPVVLGVKVTNESVNVVTDALMNLPNDKLQQIRNALCPATSSGITP